MSSPLTTASPSSGPSSKLFAIFSIITLCLISGFMFMFQFGMTPSSTSHQDTEPAGPVVPNAFIPTPFPNPPSWTFTPFEAPNWPNDGFRIGIMTIMKKEHNYISDWVKYHLAMGFDRIVLYDNEEEPAYAKILRKEGLSCCVMEVEVGKKLPEELRKDRSPATRVIMKHLPHRLVTKMKENQHVAAINDFIANHLHDDGLTHLTHWDIDEYMQLNKPGLENVRQLVNITLTDKFGIDPTCAAFSLNWIMFGNNGLTEYAPEPVPIRFTCGGNKVEEWEKFFARVDRMNGFWVHYMHAKPGYRTCTMHNDTVHVPTVHPNHSIELVQLNHYMARTWQESLHVRSRGSSVSGTLDKTYPVEEIAKRFDRFNQNEKRDYTVRNYFLKHVWKLSEKEIAEYPEYPGTKCPFSINMLEEVRKQREKNK